jgi:vancomycin permeability regulator SanA
MSNALVITKLAINVVAAAGVSKVVNDIIVNNTNVATPIDAIKVATGSVVLGSLIANHASKHVNDRIDAAHAWYVNRKLDTTAVA